MIYCGECGGKFGSMFCKENKNGVASRRRYSCYNRQKWISGGICKAPSVAESRIAEPIWDKIYALLKNPEITLKEIEKICEKDSSGIKEKISDLKKLIDDKDKKAHRLLDLYLDGSIDKDSYDKKKDQIDNGYEEYKLEKTKLESTMLSKNDKSSRIQILKELQSKYLKNLKDITYEQKHEILKMLIDKIVITKNEIDIHVNISPVSFEGQSTHGHYLIQLHHTLFLKPLNHSH